MILRNCRVLNDLTPNFNGEFADILVHNGLIEEVREPLKEISSSCIDLKGATVLPGLIDIHVHLDMLCGDLATENAMSDDERMLKSIKYAKASLEAGFTTLRDLGARNHNDIKLRDAINSGEVVGPELFVAGRILSPPTEGNTYYPGMYLQPITAWEIKEDVKGEVRNGADFIKFMGGRDLSEPEGLKDLTLYDEVQATTIVNAAKEQGTYAAVHCQTPLQTHTAINACARTIEHGFILDDNILSELKKESSFLVPTTRYLDTIKMYPEVLPDHMKDYMDEYIDKVALWMNKAYKAGLRMGFGTDAGTIGNYHGENAKEAFLRVKLAGMEPLEVIKQATIYSAMIIGLDDRGIIAPGKRADFTVFTNDPVKDIRELERPILVIKDGNIVKNNM